MLVDNHIHNKYSKDAEGEISELKDVLIKKDLKQISITNHSTLPGKYSFDGDGGMIKKQIRDYKKDIETLRKKLPGKIINFGVEIDYIEGYEKYIKNYLEKFGFEFSLGSVHFIRGMWWDQTEKKFNELIETFGSVKKVIQEYYRLIRKISDLKIFDCISHFDYIKKANINNRFFSDEEEFYTREIKKTLDTLKKNNSVIEVNTSGLFAEIKEQYPSFKILKMCQKKKIPVTLGSDAHKKEDIGKGFNHIVPELKKIGFEKIVMFNKHQKSLCDF
ncbi:histidinol-phosphatase HisJ [Candidatus Woesearchaeota archaeon]|nr:histidinol-phosphatase HisJ [Candidatus Woesearchaeota archaeon]